jgi:hypothetical protein
VTIEEVPEEGGRKRRRTAPLEVHAALLAPYVGDYEPPELVYED